MTIESGREITKEDIIDYYINNVVSETKKDPTIQVTIPNSYFPTTRIGPVAVDPTKEQLLQEITADNIVQVLKDHAWNLTRFRKATWQITYSDCGHNNKKCGHGPDTTYKSGTYLTNKLSRLSNDFRAPIADFDNIVRSKNLEKNKVIDPQEVLAFIDKLKEAYISYRETPVLVRDCHGNCHGSCHSSHSNRSRR